MSFIIFDLMGPSTDTSRRPIQRPEVPNEKQNPEGIGSLLKDGNAIIAWYNLMNIEDIFFAYRITDDRFICKYQGLYDDEGHYFWKLQEVYLVNKQAIDALWTNEWKKFGHLYVDKYHMDEQNIVIPNITIDDVLKSAHDAEPFFVDDSIYKMEEKQWNR